MRKLETKKAYFYPIKDRDGSPLELMNVLTYVKNDDGRARQRIFSARP